MAEGSTGSLVVVGGRLGGLGRSGLRGRGEVRGPGGDHRGGGQDEIGYLTILDLHRTIDTRPISSRSSSALVLWIQVQRFFSSSTARTSSEVSELPCQKTCQ